MIITKAPLRVSFFGDRTDYPEYFLDDLAEQYLFGQSSGPEDK